MVVSHPGAAERRRSLGDRFVSPVLVGREREIGLLLEAIHDPPRFVFVTGDGGMGKTRLCEAIFGHQALVAHRFLHGRCQPLREPFPFGPLVEAVRGAARHIRRDRVGAVAGALVPLIPELADRLPPPLEPLGDPRSERHRVFRALVDVLASVGPATLVIEDLHWADEGTWEFLLFMSDQIPAQLSVLATLRQDEIGEGAALRRLLEPRLASSQVDLTPLTAADVQTMLASILETDISEEFAAFLHERSGGVPFAVEELLRLLQDKEDLVRQSGRWIRREIETIKVPAGLREPVLERLRRLSRESQRIVEAAAIVGQAASERFLLTVANVGSGPDALAEALSSMLLVETGRNLGFRHVVAMHAVEEAVPEPVKHSLHLRAGRELERADSQAFGRLVRHFREAGQWAEFVRYSEAAADIATEHGDDASAAHFLTQAIRTGQIAQPDRVRMSLKLGKAALHGREHQQAIPVLQRIVDDAEIPPGDRGGLRMALCALQVQAGDARAYDQVLNAADEVKNDPEKLLDAVRTLAWPLSPQRTLKEHQTWMERASVLIRDLSDPVLEMAVRTDEAFLLLYSGHPRGLQAAADISVNLDSREAQREYIRGQNNFAYALAMLGHHERAVSFVRNGMRLSERYGYERFLTSMEIAECLVRFATGSWRGLEQQVKELIERSTETPLIAVNAELVLGKLLLAKGRVSSAEQVLTDVSARSLDIPAVVTYAAAQEALARLALSRDNAKRASELIRPAFAMIRRKEIWVWAGTVLDAAVEALVGHGRLDEAELVVSEVRAGIRGRDAPLAQAALSASLGLLGEARGDVAVASRFFRKASDQYAALPCPVRANSQRARMGLLLLAESDPGGLDMLEQAVRAFDRMGASWEAAQVRRKLRRAGVTLPYRGGRRGYGSSLSPREVEVARLAGEFSNRQIAELLFLSVKTVEKHMGSAMRKVHATRRAELVEHLTKPQSGPNEE